jgi:hypothetical protein
MVTDDLDVAPYRGHGLSSQATNVPQGTGKREDLNKGDSVRLADDTELATPLRNPTYIS